jgi:subtilisin family serine protease
MPNDNQDAPVDSYRPDEFVVALPYASTIMERARQFGLTCETVDSPALGLSLLRPAWQADSPAVMRAAVRERMARPDRDRVFAVLPPPRGGPRTPLEDLMFCLRYDFAAGAGGWLPPMGKNREIGVIGVPHVDGGSISEPEHTQPPDWAASGNDRGAGVRVGILDTGLYQHPVLAGGYLADRADLVAPADPYAHLGGHAAFVAGLVRRGAGRAELVVKQVLDNHRAKGTVWDLAQRMVEFRDSGVRILNLSLGCYTTDGDAPFVLARAVRLLAPDMVIVAAAGNHGDVRENAKRGLPEGSEKRPFWPAAFEDVVAVGALTPDRGGWCEADFSPRLPWITLLAEGDEVVSAYLDGKVDVPGRGTEPFGGWARWAGTSFAAGVVSGKLAALCGPDTSPWAAVRELAERVRRDPAGRVRLFTM